MTGFDPLTGSQDDDWDKYTLKEVCLQVIASANECGIRVADHVTADEIRDLQSVVKPRVEQQLRDLEEQKASKFLRAAAEEKAARGKNR